MSVGSWNPGQSQDDEPLTVVHLERFIALAKTDSLENMQDELSEADRSLGEIMRWDEAQWLTLLEEIESGDLLQLIRFFTLAESKLPGWEAGVKSPVIVINKLLKTRGERLDRDLLLWIRKNSQNRFIPNGSVL